MIDPPDPTESARRPDDLDDFLAMLDRHERRVIAVVSRFLDDQRDIEEAVQDTFVQAWRHRDDFRGEAAVFTWLYRIATNTALMRLRRKKVATVELDETAPGQGAALGDDPLAHHSERMTTIDEIRTALAALPEHHRVVVILRDVEGFSNAEVADIIGLPITTVKAQLHRGRASLRRALHRDD